MANPQTWTDPNTGEEYELVPDAAPKQTSWKDPKSGEEYELVPNTPSTAQPTTAESPSFMEGIGAGFRAGKDEIPYLQARRREEAYAAIANKMGKNLVTDYISPKAAIPGLEAFGGERYDYDSLFNDMKTAGLTTAKDRNEFEKSFLSREGERNKDLKTAEGAPVGSFLGGAAASLFDPVNMAASIATGGVSKGASLLKGMGIEGGVNALTELAQLPFTNDALESLGQEMTPEDMAARVAMAGGFGAGLHGVTRALGIGDEASPVRTAENVVDGKRAWTQEEMTTISKLVNDGASVEDIAKIFPLNEEQKAALQANIDIVSEDPSKTVKFEDVNPEAKAPEVDEEPLPFEAPDFLRETPVKDSKVQMPEPKPPVSVDDAVSHINETISRENWKGAPEFSVARNVDELPEEVRQGVIEDGAENAMGITVNGKVYILSDNLKNKEDLSAVTYHEALGHVGLERQFREKLDNVLTKMYETNDMVREAADSWLAKNTTQSTNPIAHAVEEILAETSEAGKIDARVWAKIKAFVKQYARRIPGLKNLKYTDEEVFAILSMAHQKVIDGGNSVGRMGNRYMRMFDTPRAANDDRVSLKDRPSYPAHGASRAEMAEYHEKTAQYLRARAAQMQREGRKSSAERSLFNAEGEEKLARMFRDEASSKSEAEFYRKEAEFYEARSKKWFAKGKVKLGEDFRVKAEEARAKAAKYAEKAISNKYSKPDKNGERTRGLRLDKIQGKKKSFYEPFLRQLDADAAPKVVQTWEETAALAEDIGMNVDKVMKLDRGPKAEEFTASVNFMMGRLNLIGDLSEKIEMGNASDRDKDKFAILLRQFADMYDVLSETKTNIARTMNIMNRIVENEKSAANNIRYMLSEESQKLLDDPNKLRQLASKINELKGNTAGQVKAIKLLTDPRFEDYIGDVWFNSILSNPITHKINMLGSIGNFITDIGEHGVASIFGQVRRGNPQADRVLAREVLYRFYGAAMGLKGSIPNAVKAFMAGEPVTKIGAYERSHNLAKGKWALLEGPSRALAMEDEFMRNIIRTSSYYGMAVRTAAKEGLLGTKELFKRANELVINPTDEMILTAADYTRALQFVDKPSKPASAYLRVMSKNPKDSYSARAGKFFGSLFTPFIPTADSIFRSAIRRSPLGGFDRYNKTDWAAGGARKDIAAARIIMGSMLAMWVANETLEGNISGKGPEDFRRREEMMAGGWRPNSIKIGNKWYPYDGLDPLAMNLAMVSTAVEDYEQRKVDDKGYADKAFAALGGVVRAMGESSWLKSFAFMTEGIKDAKSGQQVIENLALNTSTGMVPYSGMGRFLGQLRDPVERDVSSDGSMAGRFEDRIKSVVPFMKETLPARHDVYGREKTLESRDALGWLGRHAQTTIDNDPTVVELQRLATDSGKTLIPPVQKDDAKKFGIERMDSEQFQTYQDYAGDLILAASKEVMATPEWGSYDDPTKIKVIKKVASDMRKLAREDLFGSSDEEEQPWDEYNDEE